MPKFTGFLGALLNDSAVRTSDWLDLISPCLRARPTIPSTFSLSRYFPAPTHFSHHVDLLLHSPPPLISCAAQTYPLIVACGAGAVLAVLTGGRKLMHHPDTLIDREGRTSGLAGPKVAEDSIKFRQGTGVLGTFLFPISARLRGMMGHADDKMWDISRDSKKVPVPLEYSDAFDDGLYTGAKRQDPFETLGRPVQAKFPVAGVPATAAEQHSYSSSSNAEA